MSGTAQKDADNCANPIRNREVNGYPTAFNFAFKTQGNFYDWLGGPGNETRLARFGHAMKGTSYWELAENIIHGVCLAFYYDSERG
ncbi:hypothetical protein LXA43DRAFT_1098523 [Ganoderma leucocontextum]|nr:hypothetical protein LXA43DRAFT_1098523 [Ganoderma leucocontextum]